MSTKISILMGICNETKKELTNSIGSILKQTFKDFELILILDNPKNKEAIKTINSLKDKRIKLIKNSKNIGLAKTLNKGIKNAKGKYIARMDADDISDKNRLKIQYEYLEKNKNIDLCFTWTKYIDEKGKLKANINPKNNLTKNLKKNFYKRHLFTHPSLMCRSEVLIQNNYDENFRKAQDYELWQRLIYKNYKFAIIEKYLLSRTIFNNDDYDNRINKVRGAIKYRLKGYNKNFKLFNIYFLITYFKTLSFRIFLLTPKPLLVLVLKIKNK